MFTILAKYLRWKITHSTANEELDEISEVLNHAQVAAQDRMRILAATSTKIPEIKSFDQKEVLPVCIQQDDPPWNNLMVEPVEIPGMISEEEWRYYEYLTQFYSGVGEVVEIGPWLGKSTTHIVHGLVRNPAFKSKILHVYDDFVWRPAWMNFRVHKNHQLDQHQNFRFLFDQYTEPIREHIRTEEKKISDYDGNEDREQLHWDGKPIEMIILDCGRTFKVNQAWYDLFSPSFIPNRTLIVMQDWRVHREIPVQWYNQIKQFTDSLKHRMQLIHELKNGCTATFLFTGSSI